MKKLLALILALTMVFALTACSGDAGEEKRRRKQRRRTKFSFPTMTRKPTNTATAQ